MNKIWVTNEVLRVSIFLWEDERKKEMLQRGKAPKIRKVVVVVGYVMVIIEKNIEIS